MRGQRFGSITEIFISAAKAASGVLSFLSQRLKPPKLKSYLSVTSCACSYGSSRRDRVDGPPGRVSGTEILISAAEAASVIFSFFYLSG
jgi:hypothetical protein